MELFGECHIIGDDTSFDVDEINLSGTPILSDGEFDTLKRSLKEAQSPIAVSTEPKCLVDTGICTVVFQEDSYRMGILYLPAVLLTTSFWLTFTFELIEPIRYINPIFTLGKLPYHCTHD